MANFKRYWQMLENTWKLPEKYVERKWRIPKSIWKVLGKYWTRTRKLPWEYQEYTKKGFKKYLETNLERNRKYFESNKKVLVSTGKDLRD